jgi:hypothetical protein
MTVSGGRAFGAKGGLLAFRQQTTTTGAATTFFLATPASRPLTPTQIRDVFAHDEQRYLLNRLFLDGYCVWVQSTESVPDKFIAAYAAEVSACVRVRTRAYACVRVRTRAYACVRACVNACVLATSLSLPNRSIRRSPFAHRRQLALVNKPALFAENNAIVVPPRDSHCVSARRVGCARACVRACVCACVHDARMTVTRRPKLRQRS